MAYGATESESGPSPEIILSDREYGILRMLLRGMGGNEMARELPISNKTISTDKARLMKTLDVDNNADLVRYVMKHGLG